MIGITCVRTNVPVVYEKLTGDVGLRAIAEGWRTVLKLRWNIEPGDSIN